MKLKTQWVKKSMSWSLKKKPQWMSLTEDWIKLKRKLMNWKTVRKKLSREIGRNHRGERVSDLENRARKYKFN